MNLSFTHNDPRPRPVSNGMKKVVTIGGGTGSYTVLRGLKNFTYRFEQKGSPLHGHSFGNLLLLALSSMYGSEIEGIRKASQLLNLKGKVLPVSLDKAHVHAVLEDGTEIVGEANIDVPKHNANLKITSISLKPDAKIFEETSDAIRQADIIVIGPGDLYTSVIPNLLVGGMKEALRESRGKTVAICNLMTKWGETNDSAASDMMQKVLHYSGLKQFDYVICNTEKMDPTLVETYAREKKYPVACDVGLKECARKVITGNFFSELDIARHDSDKLAEVIAELS